MKEQDSYCANNQIKKIDTHNTSMKQKNNCHTAWVGIIAWPFLVQSNQLPHHYQIRLWEWELTLEPP